jgi:hypothetical protein
LAETTSIIIANYQNNSKEEKRKCIGYNNNNYCKYNILNVITVYAIAGLSIKNGAKN